MTAEAKTYSGECHCGKVKFEITTTLGEVISCNCSLCNKAGTLFTFVPMTAFKLHSGEDALADYQFGPKKLHHFFCATCGVRPFAGGNASDGTEMRGVNVRCLDGVDIGTLNVSNFDGKSL